MQCSETLATSFLDWISILFLNWHVTSYLIFNFLLDRSKLSVSCRTGAVLAGVTCGGGFRSLNVQIQLRQ